MSIRVRFLLLVLGTALLSVILVGWRHDQDRDKAIDVAINGLAATARTIATNLDARIQATAQLQFGLSLSYLQRLPFDKIKIDRCFVKDVAEPDGAASIVQAVVNIAAARNMTTTAEGVETEQQREMLHKLGCTEMQGWLFSPAIPAADIMRLLQSRCEKAVATA